MRTKGSGKELEVKRRIACNLFQQGKTRAEVARLVGTSWASANRWKKAFDARGWEGIAAKKHPGRSCRLSQRQQQKIVKILEQGPLKAGFPNDLWNAERVGQVIERTYGVKYHDSHVLKLLARWGFSRQLPERCAREQAPGACRDWRRVDWKRIKKGTQTPS